ncbi:MAG: hypothetical protein JOZ81_28125 [Chloroflexi bacterium]|nr:hypothetical protein [Chloroflexota bacterium]
MAKPMSRLKLGLLLVATGALFWPLSVQVAAASQPAVGTGQAVTGRVAEELTDQLDSLNGSIDFQGTTVSGQVALGRGSAALDAQLTDSGPEGKFSVAIPGLFVGTVNVANSVATAQTAVCVGAQEIGVSGGRESGLHLQFRNTNGDPTACTVPASANVALVMAPLIGALGFLQAAPSAGDTLQLDLLEAIRRFVVFGLIGVLLWLFTPGISTRLEHAARTAPWARLGLGLCVAIVMPVIGVLIFVFGLSTGVWWLGLLVLAFYAGLLAISLAVTGLVLGAWLLARAWSARVPPLVAFAVGIVVLIVLGLIPTIGLLINVLATIYGLGALLLAPRESSAAGPVAAPLPAQAVALDALAGVPTNRAPVPDNDGSQTLEPAPGIGGTNAEARLSGEREPVTLPAHEDASPTQEVNDRPTTLA